MYPFGKKCFSGLGYNFCHKKKTTKQNREKGTANKPQVRALNPSLWHPGRLLPRRVSFLPSFSQSTSKKILVVSWSKMGICLKFKKHSNRKDISYPATVLIYSKQCYPFPTHLAASKARHSTWVRSTTAALAQTSSLYSTSKHACLALISWQRNECCVADAFELQSHLEAMQPFPQEC